MNSLEAYPPRATSTRQPGDRISSCFKSIESVDDAFEVGYLQRSATNQTTVYIGVSEQFLGVRRLAAATVEDRAVIGNLLAILLSYG